ncbi:hypothetical protein ACJJTC_014970 [Scirpophaga incertulas]
MSAMSVRQWCVVTVSRLSAIKLDHRCSPCGPCCTRSQLPESYVRGQPLRGPQPHQTYIPKDEYFLSQLPVSTATHHSRREYYYNTRGLALIRVFSSCLHTHEPGRLTSNTDQRGEIRRGPHNLTHVDHPSRSRQWQTLLDFSDCNEEHTQRSGSRKWLKTRLKRQKCCNHFSIQQQVTITKIYLMRGGREHRYDDLEERGRRKPVMATLINVAHKWRKKREEVGSLRISQERKRSIMASVIKKKATGQVGCSNSKPSNT